jgi:cell division protein FtsB
MQQQMPLSDTEEAVLQLLQQVSKLEEENKILKEEIKQLNWSLQEHD